MTCSRSSLDVFPNEIISEIFALACQNDTETGLALALTSKHARSISNPLRIRTVRVSGLVKLKSFMSFLTNLPKKIRRVQRLQLSDIDDETGDISYRERRKVVHPRKSVRRTVMSPAVQRETDILNAITQILTLIAPHLDILSLFLTFPRRSFLIDVRLPRLEELSLYGPFPDAGVDDDQCYVPSLHRVHFGAVPAPVGADGGPDYVEEAIRRAPKLTHIRLSLFGNLVRAPLAMISTIERLMSKDKEKENSTSMLEEILYQPGVATWCSGCGTSWPNHDPIVKRMRQLALTTTGFSVLFPRLSGETGCIYDDEDSMRDWELAQLAWSNRMQRGDWRR